MAHQAEARHSNGHGNTNGHGPPCPYLRKPACGLTRIEPRWLIRQMTARQSARQHRRARLAVPLPPQTCLQPDTDQIPMAHQADDGTPCPYFPAEE